MIGPSKEQTHAFQLNLLAVILPLAVVMEFGLLSILWNDLPDIPAIVWTGSSAVLMTATIVLCRGLPGSPGPLLGIVLTFLCTYPMFCLLSYLLEPLIDEQARDLLTQNALLMVLGAILFVFGSTVWRLRGQRAFIPAFAIIVVYVMLRQDTFTMQYIYERFQDIGATTDYQHFGDAFVIASLILVQLTRRGWQFVLLAAVSIVVMFVIPSRSAAVLGAACLPLGLLVTAPVRVRWQIIGVLLAAGLLIYSLPLVDIFSGTRFESLVNSEPDGSLMIREDILQHGLRVLHERPLTGAWAFQIEAMGLPGLYVHGLLDAWVQAGLVSFLLFLAIWARCAVEWFRLVAVDREAAGAVLPLLTFAFLSWLTSRNVAYVLPFFCLGYASGAMGGTVRAPSVEDEALPVPV